MENSFRQPLLMGDGSFMIFGTRPISALILCAAALLLVLFAFKRRRFAGVDVEG
jgi:TctA family transporter